MHWPPTHPERPRMLCYRIPHLRAGLQFHRGLTALAYRTHRSPLWLSLNSVTLPPSSSPCDLLAAGSQGQLFSYPAHSCGFDFNHTP